MDGEKCHRKTHEKYEKPVRFLTMPVERKLQISNMKLTDIPLNINTEKKYN